MTSQPKGIFKIQNSQIRTRILSNVPLLKLMHLFQFSHSYQELLKMTFTSYENLSKIDPKYYNSIKYSISYNKQGISPDIYFSKIFSYKFLTFKPQISFKSNSEDTSSNFQISPAFSLCYCPSTDNLLFVINNDAFLLNNTSSTTQHIFSSNVQQPPISRTFFCTITACLEISQTHAVIVISDSIYSVSLSDGKIFLIHQFKCKEKNNFILLSLTKVSTSSFLISDSEGGIHLFDITKRAIVGKIQLSENVKGLIAFKESEENLIAYRYNDVYVINIKSKTIHVLKHNKSVFRVEPLTNYRIASADSSGVIKIWNGLTKEEIWTLKMGDKFVNILMELPNECMLSAGNYNEMVIWDIHKGEKRGELKKHSAQIIAVLLMNDLRIISSGLDKLVCIWNYEREECLMVIMGMESAPNCFVQAKDDTIYYINTRGEGKRLVLEREENEILEKLAKEECVEIDL